MLVVKAIVTRNSLKHILVDNGRSINFLFGATYDKMMIDHELTPMIAPCMASPMTVLSLEERLF